MNEARLIRFIGAGKDRILPTTFDFDFTIRLCVLVDFLAILTDQRSGGVSTSFAL